MAVLSKFKSVLSKAAQVWAHPYMSPLTTPLKMIGKFGLSPVRNFAEVSAKGYAEGGLIGAWKKLFSYNATSTTELTGIFGALFGALGATGTAAFMTITSGASVPVVVAATGAALGAGVLVGPLALATTVAAIATAGSALVLGPLGFLNGAYSALKYAVGNKNTPAPSTSPTSMAEGGAPAGTYSLQQLRDEFGIQVQLPDVTDQLSAMPKAERERQIESLAETFNTSLRAAMREDVGESMTLSSTATGKAARLKIPAQ